MKRFLAGLLSVVVALTALPMFAFAQSEEESQEQYLSSEINLLTAEEGGGELISATEVGDEYFRQTIGYYKTEEENYSDPQLEGYTDEDFFGVYDGENWVKESVLNYEEFPALSEVEAAAMEGDYTAAKEALLNYYRERYETIDLGGGRSSTRAVVNKARLNLENASTSSNVADFIKVTRDVQNFEVNVTDIVKESISSSGESRAMFHFTALRKDGLMAVFSSKESDSVPTLSINVNGRERTYTPIADAYVQAGSNANENYGDEPVIIVEESYSTIGVLQPSRIDSYTKRGILLFDFSDINSGDKISTAKLKISGSISESDNPVRPDTLPSYKDIAVMSLTDIQWTDEDSTWDSVGGVGNYKCYWGEYSYETPEINSLRTLAENAFKVYFSTGEEAYAYAGLRMILESARHQMVSGDIWLQRSLSVSSLIAEFPPAFADILKLPCLTPEKFGFLMKFIYLTSELASETWTTSENTNNWGTANASGVAISAICYPEFRAASEPLEDRSTDTTFYGGWLEVGRNRLRYMAEKCLFEDGSCIEVSFAYTKYILTLFQGFFNICNKLEVNAKEILGEDATSAIEQYAIYMLSMSNPIGGSWQQGDENQEYTTNAMGIYKVMIEAFGNPQLKWLYSGKTEGEVPDYLSIAYDDGRKAVLRSGWEKTALALQINADGGLHSHGHGDDLGLNLFAYDKMLLADPRQPNYNTDEPVTAWLYSRGHNIIEINGVSQRKGPRMDMTITNAEGEEEELITSGGTNIPGSLHPEDREFNPLYNYIKAETLNYVDNSKVDENFTSIREVLMLSPKFVIVTDFLKPDGMDGESDLNSYSQYWHSIPGANLTVDSETGVGQTHFDTGANITIVPVKGEIETKAEKHKGWYSSSNIFADYVSYLKKGTEAVTFNTVLYPTTATEEVEITTQRLNTDVSEGDASAFDISINNKKTRALTNASYYNLHNADKKGERSFGSYVTDGTLAYAQTIGGQYETAILRNGSVLKTESGVELIKSDSQIPDLGVKWSNSDMYLYSSKEFASESFAGVESADVNLALGKEATGSAHYESSLPNNTLDGNYDTFWSSPWEILGGEYPWLSVDLGEEKNISRLKVYDDNKALTYSFCYTDEEGNWIRVEETNSYQDPLSDDDKPCKIYEFSPFKSRNIKICADDGVSLLIYEIEAYSSAANVVSLCDLSVYAPENVGNVYINDESVDFYRNGEYIVFDESAAGDSEHGGESESGNSGTVGDSGNSNHGSGGSGGGGGSSDDKDDNKDKDDSEVDVVTPSTTLYPDIETHWAKSEITALAEKEIISGYGDGSFKPDNKITRAEFLALGIRLLGTDKMVDISFSDVNSSDWYYDIVSKGVAEGVISDDKAFRPNDPITREEMCKIISIISDKLGVLTKGTGTINFKDSHDISPWAENYVAQMALNGIIKGNDKGEFLPKGKTTRAEAATVIYRILKAKAK